MKRIRVTSLLWWAMLVGTILTIGFWSGYANLLFKYDSVHVADRELTEARVWHDFIGTLHVVGNEGSFVSAEPVAFALHGARVAPGSLYVTIVALWILTMCALAGMFRRVLPLKGLTYGRTELGQSKSAS